jgi:hypothetical protein
MPRSAAALSHDVEEIGVDRVQHLADLGELARNQMARRGLHQARGLEAADGDQLRPGQPPPGIEMELTEIARPCNRDP